jgi:hypothetical protein
LKCGNHGLKDGFSRCVPASVAVLPNLRGKVEKRDENADPTQEVANVAQGFKPGTG